MFLIFVGIAVIVIGFVLAKTESPFKTYTGTIRIAGFLILLLGLAVASVKQIEPGDVGVQKLFGKVNSNILESGLNVINPLVEVVTFDVRTQNYTMSGVHDEGEHLTAPRFADLLEPYDVLADGEAPLPLQVRDGSAVDAPLGQPLREHADA